MRYSWALALALGATVLLGSPSHAQAQVSVQIGVAPDCPYGYYDYSPYSCAPYGYYGPEWFSGGVFIGAGPWYHGRGDFHGHVNNRYDPHHGYHGPTPQRGEKPVQHPHNDFRGNEARDGRGHTVDEHHR